MRINVEGLAPPPKVEPLEPSPSPAPQGPSFAETLQQAIDDVSGAMHEADKTAADALVGEASPHEAMIAMTKADLQFRVLTQTRNKLVNAYNELMNLRM